MESEPNATALLAHRLDALMRLRGWTLVDLEKRSGVSKSAISNIRNYRDRGDKHPTTKTVEMLARAFDLQAWQLLQPETAAAAVGDSPDLPDIDLLTASIRTAATVFRARRILPDDTGLARLAAAVYAAVRSGATLKRAGELVSAQLDAIGTKYAAEKGSSTGRGTHGRPGTRHTRKART